MLISESLDFIALSFRAPEIKSNRSADNSGVLLWWKSVINKLSGICTDRFFVKASLRKPRCQAEQVFNEKCQAKKQHAAVGARRGTGAWLEAVDGSIAKREHICVQDLL